MPLSLLPNGFLNLVAKDVPRGLPGCSEVSRVTSPEPEPSSSSPTSGASSSREAFPFLSGGSLGISESLSLTRGSFEAGR